MEKILLLVVTVFFTSNSFATVKYKRYQDSVVELEVLEKGNNFKVAALKAAYLAKEIADKSNFDEMVVTMNRTLTEKQEEVVTEDHRAGGSFRILFGLIGGSAHKTYDSAKILTANPKQVEAFTRIKARDFRKLQVKLESYTEKNETELFYAKIFAAKALEMTARLPIDEMSQIYSIVMSAVQRVSYVNFIGFQNITNCIRVDYAERKRSWGISLSGLIGLSLGESETRRAYRETTCNSETIEHSVSELALNSVDLYLADAILVEQFQKLQLKIVDEVEAPVYPTWGSPYLHN